MLLLTDIVIFWKGFRKMLCICIVTITAERRSSDTII